MGKWIRRGLAFLMFCLAFVELIDKPRQIREWVAFLTGLNPDFVRWTIFLLATAAFLAVTVAPSIWSRPVAELPAAPSRSPALIPAVASERPPDRPPLRSAAAPEPRKMAEISPKDLIRLYQQGKT